MKNQRLWEWVESEIRRIGLNFGEVQLIVKVQDGIAIHADVTEKKSSYRALPRKSNEDLIS